MHIIQHIITNSIDSNLDTRHRYLLYYEYIKANNYKVFFFFCF